MASTGFMDMSLSNLWKTVNREVPGKSGMPQSMGSQRVGHDLVNK